MRDGDAALPKLLWDFLLPPPKKEVMFLVRSVCLSVCLSVCPSDYSQICERILTKFFGGGGMAQGPSDTFLVAIWITLRIRKSKVRNRDSPDRRRFVLSEHRFLVFILFYMCGRLNNCTGGGGRERRSRGDRGDRVYVTRPRRGLGRQRSTDLRPR